MPRTPKTIEGLLRWFKRNCPIYVEITCDGKAMVQFETTKFEKAVYDVSLRRVLTAAKRYVENGSVPEKTLDRMANVWYTK